MTEWGKRCETAHQAKWNDVSIVFPYTENPDVYLLDATDNVLTDPGTPLSQAIW